MPDERDFPDEPADEFPRPPVTFEDGEGREIEIRADYGSEEGREALVEMYCEFDPSDRAQGIPPSGESAVRDWLGRILREDCLNVIAWHGDDAAGHATLVPGQNSSYELAIFVLQGYQQAGIGTRLIETLLGYGAREGVEKVWLTVERWNRAAISLYEKIGFETTGTESFEREMTLRLDTDE